ncbi:MAG: PD40 domain-containing protein [Planctomycetes bacterium]|nr:PD40 domain-containing protein [Planctomycetota bacterium]
MNYHGISAAILTSMVFTCLTAELRAGEKYSFGEPRPLGIGVNEGLDIAGGSMTAGGLELYFFAYQGDSGAHIWQAARARREDGFTNLKMLPFPINHVFWNSWQPWISPDGRVLYYSSRQPGTLGDYDIWMAVRGEDGAFGDPIHLDEPVNSAWRDLMGALSCDGTELYFASERPGGDGVNDLYVARRADPRDTDPKSPFTIVDRLEGSLQDEYNVWPPSISPDGLALFYSDGPSLLDNVPRPGGLGQADLWMACRPALGAPWGEPVHLSTLRSGLNTAVEDVRPVISCDGQWLLFASSRSGRGDLWEVPVSKESQSCEPPVSVRREIVSPRDPISHCGDFLPGDTITVELTIAEVQEPRSGCEAEILVKDTPPAGWTIVDNPDGGHLANGSIEWKLAPGEVVKGRVLRYQIVVPETDIFTAQWAGTVGLMRAGSETRAISGQSAIGLDTPFGPCGGIHCWNILGAFRHRGACCSQPGEDFLTDGAAREFEFLWFPGSTVHTDFAGAAASAGLLDDPNGRNPDGVPAVFPWNNPDELVNLEFDVFGGGPESHMAYAQIYVRNTLDRDREVWIEASVDNYLMVEVIDPQSGPREVLSFDGGAGSDACSPQGTSFEPVLLKPGIEYSLVAKVFETGGLWDFALRLVEEIDENGVGKPVTGGIELAKVPAGVECIVPPLSARRSINTGETVSIQRVEELRWREGEIYEVAIELSGVRLPGEGPCDMAGAVTISERVPQGWVIDGTPSHGGLTEGETITWTLQDTSMDHLNGKVLTYRVRAGGAPGKVRFYGRLAEDDPTSPSYPLSFPIGGVQELHNPAGLTDQGFINAWRLAGPFDQSPLDPGRCTGGEEAMRRDWAATGFRRETPEGCAILGSGFEPWIDQDDTIDFEDFYCGNLDRVVCEAVTEIELDKARPMDLGLAFAEAAQVLLDGEEVGILDDCKVFGFPNQAREVWPVLDAQTGDYKFVASGLHEIRVKVFGGTDEHGFRLRLEDPETAEPITEGVRVLFETPRPRFTRGDCNGDGDTSGVSDPIFLLSYDFLGTEKPPCRAACDVNGDGDIGSVTDAIYQLTFSFLGGPPPVPPFPNCGQESLPPEKALECETPLERCNPAKGGE